MKRNKKAFLIAEILLKRQLPLEVIKEITDLAQEDITTLQTKVNLGQK